MNWKVGGGSQYSKITKILKKVGDATPWGGGGGILRVRVCLNTYNKK